MNPTDVTTRLDTHLTRLARRWAPQVAVHSPAFNYRFGEDLPFHATSVGKLVTTALILQLVDDGTLTTATPVADVLGVDELRGLVADGAEREVSVEHLLTHTSGVNDYVDGKTTGAPTLRASGLAELDRRWTPAELLDHTREHQRPVGRPGERFLYSDSGFVLLGLLLESATTTPFERLAHERVFNPLGMDSAFFPFRTAPARGSTTIAPLTLGRVRVDEAPALTLDWAGGGIAATPDDFLTLMRTLRDGTLVRAETWRWATTMRSRFQPGMPYGAGTMGVRFEGLVPWARNWPHLVGHLGISAAHLWHDPVHDADIVLNLGSTGGMRASFRALYEVVGLLRKLG